MKSNVFLKGDGSNYENRPGGNPAADYSEGASHVLAVIHQILNHHRALEQKWHSKKIKLHQRLALRLFQEDVKQVIFKLLEDKLKCSLPVPSFCFEIQSRTKKIIMTHVIVTSKMS